MSPANQTTQLPAGVIEDLAKAGVVETGNRFNHEVSIDQLRRRRLRRGFSAGEFVPGYLTLYEQDGVKLWDVDDGSTRPVRFGRAGRRRGGFELVGRVIHEFKFMPVDGSMVGNLLEKLDDALNKERGLRELKGGVLGPVGAVPLKKGRILLLVHGTFSKAQAMVDDFSPFTDFTKRFADYDQVLAFEHPTLAVSPFINAHFLSRLLAGTQAEIDVICHSRGGLVVLWWIEALRERSNRPVRVVFVGSPLDGTSLAAPQKLRGALNHLTNVSFAIGKAGELASVAVPWIGVFGGLLRIFSSTTGFVAKTPVIDMAIAMIPGLAGQSKMKHNFELNQLRESIQNVSPDYAFVSSNFVPIADDERWKFWKYFSKSALSDAGADFIFQEDNDLVVDCSSMTLLRSKLPDDQIKNFPKSDRIHHLNYFSQPEVLDFVITRFGLGPRLRT